MIILEGTKNIKGFTLSPEDTFLNKEYRVKSSPPPSRRLRINKPSVFKSRD